MKIGLQTWGSEGDIQPFIALAAGLSGAGHDVTLLVTDIHQGDYTAISRRHGFAWRGVAGADLPDPQRMEEIGRRLFSTANPARQLDLLVTHWFEPARQSLFDAARELCASSDAVVGHLVLDPLRAAAQMAGVPHATLAPAHLAIPTATRRPFGAPDLGRWAIPLWWHLVRALLNRRYLPRINALRRRHGLAPDTDVLTQTWTSERLNLVAVSPVLCERPPDWGAQHRLCGFLNLAPEQLVEPMPQGLEQFLAAGAPPVYFTFGSMMARNLEYIREVARVWSEAVRLTGCRAIFQLPWADLDAIASPAGVFKLQRAPHRAIFPRCALVVHHGGAGTSQSTLLAGRPGVVVAHLVDQFFWGAELERLGVAGPSCRRQSFTSRALAASMRRVIDSPRIAARAAALGSAMAGERGLDHAVGAIEAMLAAHRS
jgi:UDP:flavonoid glycosyltransferase YjiC (YdhE family)